MNKLLKLFLLCLLPLSSMAETMYIDDTLLVPLRSGAGTSFRIINKGLSSGTALEIVKHDQSTGYSEVRTSSGQQGFLPTRYLSATPIAKQLLRTAEANLEASRQKVNQLQTELNELEDKFQSLTKEHAKASSQLDNTSKELSEVKSISANALNLDQRNKELHQSNEQLRNEIELIRAENMRLKDKSESNMMLVGGGLVTLGVIITLILPMLKPSRKTDSWA